ncbi:MAG: hypothetical protein ACRD9R_16415 [Pyrinomonadaceae bacterium]
MPLKLNTIQEAQTDRQHVVEVPLTVKDDTGRAAAVSLRVTYRPITGQIIQTPGLVDQLAAVVIDLDLEDAGGRKVEPTREFFTAQPVPFLRAMSEAIMGDFFPK